MYSINSKSLLFASISYVQVKRSQSWIKVFFFTGGFPLTCNTLILYGTNNVLHFSVTKIFLHSAESGTSEKVFQ